MNEKEEKDQHGIGRLQQIPLSSSKEKEAALRAEILACRHGHTAGGYCYTELLKSFEKELHKALTQRLGEIGQRQDSESRSERRRLEREIAGFAWKPRTVVVED